MIGHIKIDRKILNWEWYSDYKMVHLFIHLLLKANYRDNNWQGILIKRGQLISGLSKLSGNTGLTMSQTRTCLDKLQTTGEIAIKTTNKFSIITICKYDTYQDRYNQNNTQNSKQSSSQDSTPLSTQDSNTIRKQEDNNLFINMPTAAEFNGLPEIKIGSVIQLLKITKHVDISSDDVLGLWEVFKVQNLTGKKFYSDEDAVYSHFINWAKTQNIKENGTTKQFTTTGGKSAGAEQLLAKIKQKHNI